MEYVGNTAIGKAAFDHTLSTYDSSGTNNPLTVAITSSGGTNNIHTVSGKLFMQHNLASMTATATFSGVLHTIGGSSACCFPTSGTIVTSFTGGLNVGLQETMTFTSATCASSTPGLVQFIDVNGNSSTKTLTHCL